MSKENLRPVEYTVTTKSKAKKGKKSTTSKKTKQGLFHAWGTTADGKGKEKFFGLVEDTATGKLTEVSYKNLRFVTDGIMVNDDAVKTGNETDAVTQTPAAEKSKTPSGRPAKAKTEVAPAPAKAAKPRSSATRVKPVAAAQKNEENKPSAEAVTA